MNKNYEEECTYLSDIIERFNCIIEEENLRIGVIPKMYKDNELLMLRMLDNIKHRLTMLNKTQNKPYFARINFKNENGKIDECYIGKIGVSDEDNNILTVDWRAPISSLYYDSNIGLAKYESPEGIIRGELLVKRQYEIEDKKLISYQDVDTVSNDEMLKPYLGVNVNNRLKNIVSTIQFEQNKIIREPLFNNLIIQGVAGSGKTTVALHRIAYLVYNNIDKIKPEEYLVIGPSKFFVNYISGVLPDLDVEGVRQLTYLEILNDLLQKEFTIIKSSYDNDLRKSSLNMNHKDKLDELVDNFEKEFYPKEDLKIKNYVIVPKQIIKEIYNEIKNEVLSKKIEKATVLISKYIENNKDNIKFSIHKLFNEKINCYNNDEIKKEKENINLIEKELNNNCIKTIIKYFKPLSPNIVNLYISFLKKNNNTDKIIDNIKHKKVEFEDMASLVYLYYKIYGASKFKNYRHVVIDEAQDFDEFSFYVLKQIMSKATFSIFGDLAQSIYKNRIDSWDSVVTSTFNGDCNIKYLKKSYRTTTEIMNEANKITEFLKLIPAEPVIRHGLNVKYINDNSIDNIKSILKQYIDNEYSSIAIISKDEEESNLIYNQLKELKIKINNINSLNQEYNGGICTITSYLAKGLEFDSVIITDASINKYNPKDRLDMKLLYVAMTRSLHELTVLYNKNITEPLKESLIN